MKIAVVVPTFPCISETFILNHITGLIDEGLDVTIISLKENVCFQRHQIVDDYQLLRKTIFVRNRPSKKLLCRFYSAGLIFTYGLISPLKMVRAMYYLLHIDRSNFYQILFFLFAIIARNHDLYHFHFGQVGRLGASIKKMKIPIKMITSFHGHDVNQIPLSKDKDYYADLFKEGDHFIPK